jgi:hypothetical protein
VDLPQAVYTMWLASQSAANSPLAERTFGPYSRLEGSYSKYVATSSFGCVLSIIAVFGGRPAIPAMGLVLQRHLFTFGRPKFGPTDIISLHGLVLLVPLNDGLPYLLACSEIFFGMANSNDDFRSILAPSPESGRQSISSDNPPEYASQPF